MSSESPPTVLQARFICFSGGLSVLLCAGCCAAAILAPAPAAAVPVVVAVCVGYPMLVATQLPKAIAALRASGADGARALAELRSKLSQLPETEHPLGL